MKESESGIFCIGIVILAIAFGNMYSAPIGWLVLGSGFIFISTFCYAVRTLSGKLNKGKVIKCSNE